MASTWSGSLNRNEIFTSLFNMIISQQVYSDNIGETFTSLVDRARVDGTLFGDTYLKYSTDALETIEFDPTDITTFANVLEQHRPKDPFVQSITLDVFRRISITIDSYFSKRAFATESAFADFNSVCLQWLRDTKRIYDATTYNTYVGTTETSVGKQAQTVDLSDITSSTTTVDEEAYNRLVAEHIGEALANIFVALKDVTKDYNDLGYTRAYNKGDLEIIWNADFANAIRKVGLPSIYNKDGILDIKDENILPAHYFGTPNTTSKTTADANTYSLVEQTVNNVHYWAGEKLPSGTALVSGGVVTVPSYQGVSGIATGEVICKIIHKGSIPYMSAFQTETEFINPKLLNENHYLTFGHNTLTYLYNYPLITVKATV